MLVASWYLWRYSYINSWVVSVLLIRWFLIYCDAQIYFIWYSYHTHHFNQQITLSLFSNCFAFFSFIAKSWDLFHDHFWYFLLIFSVCQMIGFYLYGIALNMSEVIFSMVSSSETNNMAIYSYLTDRPVWMLQPINNDHTINSFDHSYVFWKYTFDYFWLECAY